MKALTVNILSYTCAGLYLLCGVSLPAIEINHDFYSFNMGDNGDHQCRKTSDNATTNCQFCSIGMPTWSISEPYLNLWLRDEPVFYTTSLGEHVGFELTYKQRDVRTAAHKYVPLTGWHHNWFSYIHFRDPGTNLFSSWDATLYARAGGEYQFSTSVPQNPESGFRLIPMGGDGSRVYPTNTDPNIYGRVGFRLLYPDGSQDLYGMLSATYWEGTPVLIPNTNHIRLYGTNYLNSCDAVLTEHIDQFGNSIHLNYFTNNGYFLLTNIVDYDGQSTTLTYTNTGVFTGTNLLIRVDMPYGRSAGMLYYTNNCTLASIRDAQSNVSSMNYSGTPPEVVKLTTPYGETDFSSMAVGYSRDSLDVGNAGWTNAINRSMLVSLPDGSKELYVYRYTSQEVGVPGLLEHYPIDPSPNTYDGGAPDGYGSDYLGYAYYRNTFHWNPQQYAAAAAYTNDYTQWNALHYAFASMKHWLVETNQAGFVSDGFYAGPYILSSAVSWIRDASPSGDTNAFRHVLWYDYAGKEQYKNWSLGLGGVQTILAEALEDGTTRYRYTFHDDTTGLATQFASTYTTTGGTVGGRTNQFVYDYENASTTCYGSKTNTTTTNVVGQATWEIPLLTSIQGPDGATLLGLSGTVSWTTNISRTTYNGTNYLFISLYPRRLQLGVSDAAANTSTVFFNSRPQVTGIKWANGLITTNIYDGNNFLARSTNSDSASQAISTVYYSFANGVLAARTNELGLSTKYTWDQLQRLTSITFPTDTTRYITNSYFALDLTQQKDRLGNSWGAFYDSLDRLQTITDRRGYSTTLSYCTCGGLHSVLDSEGGSTIYWRDFNGNVTNVQFAVGGSRTLTRDTLGQVTNVTDSAGLSIDLQYNNQGLLTLATTTNGTLFAASYDIYDRPYSVTTAEGVVINSTFDGLGRVLTRTYPNTGYEEFIYSTNGLQKYYDPLRLQPTVLGYDLAGRLTSVTNANQEVTRFAYDAAGDIIALTNGNGKRTLWGYDVYGRCIAETNDSNTLIVTNGYDLNGNLTARWTKAKGLTLFTPDENGNVVNIIYPHTSISYTYDTLNRIKSLSDAVGATTFSYTNFGAFYGALAGEDGPWASDTVTNNFYNRLLQSLTIIQPSGSWYESFAADNQLRLKSITTPDGTFTNGYYGAGRLIQRTGLPGGNYIDNNFTSGLLQDTWLRSASGTTLNHHGYSYDLGYYRSSGTRTDASHISYAYDNLGQLVKATAYDSAGTGTPRLNEAFGYGYDKAGNLISRTNGVLTQTFTPDNLNQLASISRSASMTVAGSLNLAPQTGSVAVNGIGAAVYNDLTFATTNGVSLVNGNNTFVTTLRNGSGKSMTNSPTLNLPSSVSLYYDYDGNLTNDGLRYFEYDDADRLAAVTVSNSWRSEYVYDGLWRRRILKQYGWSANAWNLTNEIHYLYQGMLVIQERNSTNAPLVTYTRGLDLSGDFAGAGGIGGLLARTDNTSGTAAFYHSDAGGNVTAMINSGATLQGRYLYDPFGNIVAMGGPLANANHYRFSSKELDSLSGEYSFGYRFYEPNLQRWPNRDPIGLAGGINLHAFVYNNAIMRNDPFGESDENRPPAVVFPPNSGNLPFYGPPALEPNIDPGWPGNPLVMLDLQRDLDYLLDSIVPFEYQWLYHDNTPPGFLKMALPAPGCRLFRFRNGAESASRLAKKALEAEQKLGVHGVSSSLKNLGPEAEVTTFGEAQSTFKLMQTGSDPNHYTIILPKPVTQQVAQQFNLLFQPNK